MGFLTAVMMWLVFGAVCSNLAKKRDKNPHLWFFLGMFLGLLGLIILFFIPKTNQKRKEEGPTTIDITPKADLLPQNKFWYYLDPENRQYGPMSFDALSRAWQEGKVTQKTYVWNENLDKWKRFGECIQNPSQV